MASPLPSVDISTDEKGISQVQLQNGRGASAWVSLYGGQVRSWKNNRGEELLFMSRKAEFRGQFCNYMYFSNVELTRRSGQRLRIKKSPDVFRGVNCKAIFKPPEAVRGGIPVCFPLFENRDCMETHGFARKRMWEVDANPPPLPSTDSEGRAFIDLLLIASDNDLRFWPHRFELRLRVALGVDGKLFLIPRVRNLNLTSKPFSFMFAFRTYFSVSDIDEVRVEGADTLHYLDNLLNKERFTEQRLGLTFEEEVDRVYLTTSEPFAVYDHQTKRIIVIKKQGLPDIVVWNPSAKKSKAIPDLGNDEYLRMVCVDPAAMEKPIKLKPRDDDVQLSISIRCNSMVVSWLINSVTPEISSSLHYLDNASMIWSDLRERFSDVGVADQNKLEKDNRRRHQLCFHGHRRGHVAIGYPSSGASAARGISRLG